MAAPALALVPSPARKPRLGELLDDAQAIVDTLEGLDEADDEAREALSAQLLTNLAGTKAKVDSVASVLAHFEVAEAAAKAEGARLKARADYFGRQSERLQGYVLQVLDMWNMPALEGVTSTLKARKNPASVTIDDAGEIPAEYMRSLPIPDDVPDKSLIKAALVRDPESVPGARLTQSVRLVRA